MILKHISKYRINHIWKKTLCNQGLKEFLFLSNMEGEAGWDCTTSINDLRWSIGSGAPESKNCHQRRSSFRYRLYPSIRKGAAIQMPR